MGAGRAFSVHDPSPEFIQRALRTVEMRIAAKAAMQAQDPAVVGMLRPAFDAVITPSDVIIDEEPLSNFENLIFGSRGFYCGAVGLVWVNEAGNFLLYAAWSLAPRMWRRLRL